MQSTVTMTATMSALVLALAATSPMLAHGDTATAQDYQFKVETIVKGLEHPWGMAFLPDGRFLVTERNPGQIRLGSPKGELSGPLEGVPEIFRYVGDTPRSQAGLFDIVLHPDFAENNLVYFSYSKPTERGAALAVDRGRLVENGGTARLENVETVFEMKEADQDSSGLHFGGSLAFHPEDGTLFLTVGERRNISRAQDKGDQAGAILRMTDEGEVADGNPFVGEDGADPYVYSYGHRNPQGIGFHPESGALWSHEHGPLGGDEVNLVEAGNNYGWPYVTAGKDYSGAPLGEGTEKDGMTSPAHVFDDTVAPSGMTFVTDDALSDWKGDMLLGGLITEGIVRLRFEDGKVSDEEAIEIGRRIRDVEIVDGAIYVLTEHEDGEVLRLTPSAMPAG